MTIYTDNYLIGICFLNQKFSRVDIFMTILGETNLICRSTSPTDHILAKTNITTFLEIPEISQKNTRVGVSF